MKSRSYYAIVFAIVSTLAVLLALGSPISDQLINAAKETQNNSSFISFIQKNQWISQGVPINPNGKLYKFSFAELPQFLQLENLSNKKITFSQLGLLSRRIYSLEEDGFTEIKSLHLERLAYPISIPGSAASTVLMQGDARFFAVSEDGKVFLIDSSSSPGGASNFEEYIRNGLSNISFNYFSYINPDQAKRLVDGATWEEISPYINIPTAPIDIKFDAAQSTFTFSSVDMSEPVAIKIISSDLADSATEVLHAVVVISDDTHSTGNAEVGELSPTESPSPHPTVNSEITPIVTQTSVAQVTLTHTPFSTLTPYIDLSPTTIPTNSLVADPSATPTSEVIKTVVPSPTNIPPVIATRIPPNTSICEIEIRGERNAEEGKEFLLPVYSMVKKGNGSYLKITNINIESIPREASARNVAGTSMSWSEKNRDDSTGAVSMRVLDHKWYGYGVGDTLCPQNRESTGIYRLSVKANFENGCSASKELDLKVIYPSMIDKAKAGFNLNLQKLKIKLSSKRADINSSRGKQRRYTCAAEAKCPDGKCFVVESGEKRSDKLQYSELVSSEENFHERQSISSLDWDRDGGVGGLWDWPKFQKRYAKLLKAQSKSREKTAKKACDKASQLLSAQIEKAKGQFATSVNTWINSDEVSCWRGYTSKRAVGWAESKAGYTYYCEYVYQGKCPESISSPKFYW